jgi:hypothetical protein
MRKAEAAKAVDSRFRLAAAAGRVRRRSGALARSATYDARRRRVNVELLSGSAVAVPIRKIQGLAKAKPAELKDVEVTGGGYGLHWPALDVDVAVPDLLAGCFGTRAWMSALARHAGKAKSEAKAAAARENGRKGGRPRKQPDASSVGTR